MGHSSRIYLDEEMPHPSQRMGEDGAPGLLVYAYGYGIREVMPLFARRDEAGAAGETSDQALICARPAYRCWNVVRQHNSLECPILIHEGAGFGRRASAYHGVSDDQV